MTPGQKCRHKKALRGRIESMQQSSAIPKNREVGRGLQKIVACSQFYLAVPSCVNSFWHGVIPTSWILHLFHPAINVTYPRHSWLASLSTRLLVLNLSIGSGRDVCTPTHAQKMMHAQYKTNSVPDIWKHR